MPETIKTPEIKKGFIIPTRKDYDSVKALNFSGAKELLKSPAHYKNYLTAERKETPALRVGSLIHAIVLEPEKANSDFAILPLCDRRTKEGKASYDEFMQGATGKKVVTKEEFETAVHVASTMRSIVSKIGVTFISTEFMFVTEVCGIPVKCAIDALGDDGYIYDLKSTEDASQRGFIRSTINYKYNLQALIYRTAFEVAFGIRLNGFRFIATEKEPPFAGACYNLGPEVMTNAQFDFDSVIKSYNSCSALDEWPSYPEDVQTIDIGTKQNDTKTINFA